MKKFWLLLFLISIPALAQHTRFDYVAWTTNGTGSQIPILALPGTTIRFYTGCSTLPCATPATTYISAASGTTCAAATPVVLQLSTTCVGTADTQGNFGGWFTSGTYQYTEKIGATTYGPYNFTIGGGGGGSGPNNFPGTAGQYITSYDSGTLNFASAAPTFDQIGSGTNLGHGLVCGAGCVMSPTGGGFISANELNGTLLSGLATGILKNTTATGVPSIATPGTDYLTPTGSGAGLTSLNATQLASGTVPTARLTLATNAAQGIMEGDGTTITCVAGVCSSLSGGAGTVTTTGSPTSGTLAGFSGATSITNVDLTGDVTTSGGLATTIAANAVTTTKINAAAVTNAKLANPATTVNGQTCTLGSTCTVTAVPSGSAGGALTGSYPNPTLANLSTIRSFLYDNGSGAAADSAMTFDTNGYINTSYRGMNVMLATAPPAGIIDGFYVLNTSAAAGNQITYELDTGDSLNTFGMYKQGSGFVQSDASLPNVGANDNVLLVTGAANMKILQESGSGHIYIGPGGGTYNLDIISAGASGVRLPRLTGAGIIAVDATNEDIGFATTAQKTVTVSGTACVLGGTCTPTAAAGTLTGGTLASGVTASSLVSFGMIAAHNFFGNNAASSSTGIPSLIGTSDWSPNAYVAGAGSVNVMTATLSPAATALMAGVVAWVLPNLANTTTTPTLNLSGLGAKTITKCGTTTLVAGDYSTTAIAEFAYDGTNMQLMNPQTGCPTFAAGTPAYPLTITGGVSGGAVYGSSSTQLTVSAAGAAGSFMLWGGAATAPTALAFNGTSTGVVGFSGALGSARLLQTAGTAGNTIDSGIVASNVATQSGTNVFTGTTNTFKHIAGSGLPTIAIGVGAGSAAPTLARAFDMSGVINLTTTGVPTASATVATVTFNVAFAAAPKCILTPTNAATVALTGVAAAFIPDASTTTTTFIVQSGTTPLTTATTYSWIYGCLQ